MVTGDSVTCTCALVLYTHRDSITFQLIIVMEKCDIKGLIRTGVDMHTMQINLTRMYHKNYEILLLKQVFLVRVGTVFLF